MGLLLVSGFASAQQSETCRAKAEGLAKSFGVAADSLATQDIVVSRHGARVQMACARLSSHPSISVSYPSEYPPATVYKLMADIMAQASNQTSEQMQLRAHRCHRAARRTGGHAHRIFGSYRLDCDRHATRSRFNLARVPGADVVR